MLRSILAILLIGVLAVGASAYDFLYTGDTPMTHDAGSFGIDAGVVYLTADSWYDQDGEKVEFAEEFDVEDVFDVTDASGTYMWVPINIYYAVMDNLEFGIQPKFGVLSAEATWEEARAESTDEYEGTGLGDTWIWGKYMLMPDPMLTFRLGVKVNTGTEPDGCYEDYLEHHVWVDSDGDMATGDGQMDIDGAVMFGTEAGPGMFCGALGYRYRMVREFDEEVEGGTTETVEYSPGSEIHFAAGYTYYIGEMMNLSIAADGFFGSDPEEDGEPIELPDETTVEGSNGVWVNPSFSYMMENGMELGVGFHYPLMGKNIDALWGFNAYVGWGM